jgi:hypothetical protein
MLPFLKTGREIWDAVSRLWNGPGKTRQPSSPGGSAVRRATAEAGQIICIGLNYGGTVEIKMPILHAGDLLQIQ